MKGRKKRRTGEKYLAMKVIKKKRKKEREIFK